MNAWFRKKNRLKLSFLGASRNVTGSRYLLQAGDLNILVECGIYQERQLRGRNWDPFPVDPSTINAVLLTHAHLDHCGLLPKLVREGFAGRIHCTPATAEIAKIVLLDSAHIQEEDAAYKKKRHRKEGRTGPYPVEPLYTTRHAQTCNSHFSPTPYMQPVTLGEGVEAVFYDAGHILGSAMICIKITHDGESRSILFSGDLGRTDMPIIEDPTRMNLADYVLIESTYGDRVHDAPPDIQGALADVINATNAAGGNVLIPAFSIERSQDLLYHLSALLRAKRIPKLRIFLDSPMAINVTKVFESHPEMFDEEMRELLRRKASPFHMKNLKMTRTAKESKQINTTRGTNIIIAGSGMCTGGRIKHHLANNISDERTTVIFVGYQAHGTLGRHIVDGADEVRIHGQKHAVRARIERLHGFSAHADRDDLTKWITGLKESPRGVFVVHGEESAALAFGEHLRKETSWNVSVPAYKDEVELE